MTPLCVLGLVRMYRRRNWHSCAAQPRERRHDPRNTKCFPDVHEGAGSMLVMPNPPPRSATTITPFSDVFTPTFSPFLEALAPSTPNLQPLLLMFVVHRFLWRLALGRCSIPTKLFCPLSISNTWFVVFHDQS